MVGVAGSLPSRTASAQTPGRTQVLDAEGPPSLPGLAHRDVEGRIEVMVAGAEPTDVTSVEPFEGQLAWVYATRWQVEFPLAQRRWYFGLAHDWAAASVPSGPTPGSGGSTWVLGNPELWGRGIWSSQLGLAAGGGCGLVLPLPRTFSGLEQEVVRAARVIRPWDYGHFQDLTMTARPFFDLRHAVGPVTLQMRQGLDVSVLLRDQRDLENRYDLSALVSLFAGVRALRWVSLGLELQELYAITADVSSPGCPAPCDGHRATVTLAPIVAANLGRISLATSVLLPLSTPLRAEVASFVAGRLHLTFALPWPAEPAEPTPRAAGVPAPVL
jgi:hypothetical protein